MLRDVFSGPPRRVFLSHTSELARLPTGRTYLDAAMSAVSRAGDAVVEMSFFAASDRKPAAVCSDAVRQADLFVLILGFRYGSPVSDRPELSYAELEFETATAIGIPRLVFVLDGDPEGSTLSKTDVAIAGPKHVTRQVSFRARVRELGIVTATVGNPGSLEVALFHALRDLPPITDRKAATSRPRHVPWVVPPRQDHEVDRPGPVDAVMAALLSPLAKEVGVTGVIGAGGFGKTTLARMIVHDPRVRARFPDGAAWVSVGHDMSGAALAAAMISAASHFEKDLPHPIDPIGAGDVLRRVLAGRRALIVIDDVWTSGQVDPFRMGRGDAVLLFTTRQPGVLPDDAAMIEVDQMTNDEARDLLAIGLPALPVELVHRAMTVTGRWPVLIALIAGTVRDAVRQGADPVEDLQDVLDTLATDSITALDVADRTDRARSVAATIEVGLARLTLDERERYLELAVFGEDVIVPGEVVHRLWRGTSGITKVRSRLLCQRLHAMGLLAELRRNPDELVLHDVIRRYIREQSVDRLDYLHSAVVDAHRDLLPSEADWSSLPARHTYMWSWLARHLAAAGRSQELNSTLTNLGWLSNFLENVGPARLEEDLRLSNLPVCAVLAEVVRQNSHLLGPLEPRGSLGATLISRLPDDIQVELCGRNPWAQEELLPLRPLLAQPDIPGNELWRVLPGVGSVSDLVGAPDGSWLASAGRGPSGATEIRIWEPLTGRLRHTLHGPAGRARCAAAADGSWIAAAATWPDQDENVYIWDVTTGAKLHELRGHSGSVVLTCVGGGGGLVTADRPANGAGTIRIWDPVSGELQRMLTGQRAGISALTVAPDGSWIASGDAPGGRGEVLLWDLAAGTVRATLPGHTTGVSALAVAPDGSWLAAAEARQQTPPDDRHSYAVRVWDLATGEPAAVFKRHAAGISALAVAPDGSWLASADSYVPGLGKVWVWRPRTGELIADLSGQTRGVLAMSALPDGSALVVGDGSDFDAGSVSLWSTHTWSQMAQFQGHTDGISAIAVDPDGAWLASGDTGLAQRGDVRIWRGFRRTSSAAQMPQHPMSGDKRNIAGLAVTSDGAWVASTADSPSRADEIRVWAAADGSHRRTFPGLFHRRCYLEFSPDGSMLAASGIGPNGRDVVRVWEVSSGRLRHEFRDVAQGFPRLLVTGDGSTLYGVFDRSRPARIHAWDMLSGRERLLHIESSDCISAFAISADGKRIAAGGRRSSLRTDQTPDVHVWSSEVPELLHVLPGRGHDISAIAMIASTNLLAAADAPHRAASEVRLWDLETGRLAEIFDGHTRPVRTLVAAPDGSWLASVGNEFFDPEGYGGELCVWDVATGRLRWKLADIHGTISGLVNSPDGSHILAAVTRPGAGGGEIRVWQTATGEASASLRVAGAIGGVRWTERSILIGGEKGVYCLAFGEFGSEQTSGDR